MEKTPKRKENNVIIHFEVGGGNTLSRLHAAIHNFEFRGRKKSECNFLQVLLILLIFFFYLYYFYSEKEKKCYAYLL